MHGDGHDNLTSHERKGNYLNARKSERRLVVHLEIELGIAWAEPRRYTNQIL